MILEAKVKEIVSKVMEEKFGTSELRDKEVDFEDDFDGEQIIRVTAVFRTDSVASESLFEAATAIRTQLKQAGDDRFVFVQRKPPENAGAEREDEDLDRPVLP